MRQNLTNIKEVNIEDVEHFYVVGSTTKEGLIEGRSNVKLDLKTVSAGGDGDGSSEDAQKLFEMFFGQVPYVFYNGVSEVLPITEYSTEELRQKCDTFGGVTLIYKEQEPASRAHNIIGGSDSIDVGVLSAAEIEMTPVPVDIPNGPWYYPAIGVDLSDFTLPTFGNPTTLTGVEIPQSEVLTVKSTMGVHRYDWNFEANQYEFRDVAGTYTIAYGENVWIWEFSEHVG